MQHLLNEVAFSNISDMSDQVNELEKSITRKINQLHHELNKVKEENLELHKTVKDLSERLAQFEDTSTEQFFESMKKRKKFWEMIRKKLEGSLYDDVMSFWSQIASLEMFASKLGDKQSRYEKTLKFFESRLAEIEKAIKR